MIERTLEGKVPYITSWIPLTARASSRNLEPTFLVISAHIHQYHLHINGISEPQPPARNPSISTAQIERLQTM